MELQAVMEKRRSIRNYNPEGKVTKEQLEELIKAASYAPSMEESADIRYYCVLSENSSDMHEKLKFEQIKKIVVPRYATIIPACTQKMKCLFIFIPK